MSDGEVLVVDDDRALRDAIAEVLECVGYRVVTAATGEEALQAMRDGDPRLIVLDMQMPVLDGPGFVRSLEAQGIHIPIVAMSGHRDARQWAQEIGALDFLHKPFEVTELVEAVNRVHPGIEK